MFVFPSCHFSSPPSAGFLPSDLSGLMLWLDGADAATITLGTGSAVASWADKSGNGNSAAQATGGNRPVFNSTPINGRSTLSFDNSSSFLTLTTPIDPHGSSGFGVASYVDSTGSGPILGQNGGNTFWGHYQSIGEYFLVSSNGLGLPIGTLTTPTAFGYTSQLSGSNPQTLYLDGTALTGGVDNALGSATFDTVGHRGASEWLNGSLGEVILYNRILGSTEIDQVSAYLRAKWGTP